MNRSFVFALVVACISQAAQATSQPAPHPQALDELIAHYAKMHGIPEHLIHRIVARESGYNPNAMHKRFYGLMQITYESARSMGYKGEPKGLLDPAVNLTYAVPYLANAYKAAGDSETGAVKLYAGGYYYVAKRKHLLGVMRTAASPSLDRPPSRPAAQSAPPPNPAMQLFQALTGQAASPQTEPAAQIGPPAVRQ